MPSYHLSQGFTIPGYAYVAAPPNRLLSPRKLHKIHPMTKMHCLPQRDGCSNRTKTRSMSSPEHNIITCRTVILGKMISRVLIAMWQRIPHNDEEGLKAYESEVKNLSVLCRRVNDQRSVRSVSTCQYHQTVYLNLFKLLRPLKCLSLKTCTRWGVSLKVSARTRMIRKRKQSVRYRRYDHMWWFLQIAELIAWVSKRL